MWPHTKNNMLSLIMPEAIEPKAPEPDEVMGPPKAVVSKNTRMPSMDAIKMPPPPAKAGQGKMYGYVKTPSPAPGVSDSPLMTWGEVEGTPMLLDAGLGDIGPGPSFNIKPMPARE